MPVKTRKKKVTPRSSLRSLAAEAKIDSRSSGSSIPADKKTNVIPPLGADEQIHTAPGNQSRYHRSRYQWIACVLLAIVTFAVYAGVTKHPFVNYDDADYVADNPMVQQGLTQATLRWALTSTGHANWHPLTWLSHALDWQLFGSNAAGHHFTSLLLHVLATVLLYLFLAWITGKAGRSLVVAALFGLHPINVESVAWVAERKNVLSMVFFLVTLIAYAWYARKPKVDRYLLVVGCFILALAAKPQVVTLPFVLLLLDFWPLRRLQGWQTPSDAFPVPQQAWMRLLWEKLPLLALSVASSVITVIAQGGAVSNTSTLPLLPRLTNAFYSYVMYVWKAFWPAHLAVFYPHQGRFLAIWEVALCCVFLAGMTALVWRERARRPYLLVGWLWFVGTLVPMIGIVQVGEQGMADRYAYLPLIGIFIAAVWLAADWAEQSQLSPRVGNSVATILLGVLAVLTVGQVATWKSSYDLWAHALKATKNNSVAEDFIGSAILVDHFRKTGQRYSDEALVHFENAVRMNPADPLGHLNIGADFHEHGHYREAIDQYQLALQLSRSTDWAEKALVGLGAASEQLGDLERSHDYYREALKLYPHDPMIFTGLGRIGMDRRVAELSKAVAAHPTAQGYLQIGELQRDAGHDAEARSSFKQALKLDPNSAPARSALDGLTAQTP
jgi:Tfp pilus assembly protein PilF